jgi:SSS family solute:Na+ symporter
MHLETIDWIIMAVAFAIYLGIGLFVGKDAGKDYDSYFLSGRSMPWWLLGTSMVATTFATDTPNLVAGIVRRDGVMGNWVWWAFLLTGSTTVFLFAKLWRRSNVLTDIEFYELRYSGKPAAFLRGFRAVYLGVFFNVIIMANVTLAAIKIGGVLLGLTPMQSILIASVITVSYSMVGGLTGVLLTDLVQFGVAMVGSIWAAHYILGLPEVGGLASLVARPEVQLKMAMLPDFSQMHGEPFLALFLIPLMVQWWSAYYPGAEPGGGGYVVQRVLAAKSEGHAVGATLFFNVMHYALRPWPWILVALASLVIYPMDPPEQIAAAQSAIERAGDPAKVDEATRLAARGVTSLRASFPKMPEAQIAHDLAYPALLTRLPAGLLGIVVTSLIAAYMSTMSTQVNWGSSILVNDVYRRFIKPSASENQMVWVGRFGTLALMAVSCGVALLLQDALSSFELLLQIGAGTGLLLLLRWFWWRINAAAEITAMVVSFGVAVAFFALKRAGIGVPSGSSQMLIGVAVTTVSWILVALITPPTDEATLREFYRRIQPGGPGWAYVLGRAEHERLQIRNTQLKSDLPIGLLASAGATAGIWALIFASGYYLYGRPMAALGMGIVAAIGAAIVAYCWKRLSFSKK